jgi:predicted nuclease of predicted toxin-antitoxin system
VKLWIDAQLPPSLAEWLARRFSVDAAAVRDLGLRDATDAAIFAQARVPGLVVVTKEADFVHLVERLGQPPQVLWVTCGNTSNSALREVLGARFETARALLAKGEPVVEIGDALERHGRGAG